MAGRWIVVDQARSQSSSIVANSAARNAGSKRVMTSMVSDKASPLFPPVLMVLLMQRRPNPYQGLFPRRRRWPVRGRVGDPRSARRGVLCLRRCRGERAERGQ
jgi:hypothetical protein